MHDGTPTPEDLQNYQAGLYVDKCPFCGSGGPFSVWCRAWMVFQDGEPVSQDPEDIEYAMPIVGSEPICLKCHGTWVVGQDPHGGDEDHPGYLPSVEQIRKEDRRNTAEREAVVAVGAARRRKEQLAAIRARFSTRH